MSSYIPDNNIYPTEFENCPQFLKNYLNYLMNNIGKRPLTLSQTALCLREFCQYIHFKRRFGYPPPTFDAHKDMGLDDMQLLELAQLQQPDIEEYISFLENRTRNSAATLRKKLSTIRPFFSYLVRMQSETGVQFYNDNPAQHVLSPAVDQPPQFTLSINQLRLLIDAAYEEVGARELPIMLLLATTGLNVSELAYIQLKDVHNNGWLSVTGSNGTRAVWLTGPCRNALEYYYQVSGIHPAAPQDQFLFPSARHPDKPITQNTIRNIVSRTAKNAGLPRYQDITPKVIRDSVANLLYEAAAPHERVNVSQYLGYRINGPRHAGIGPSSVYTEDAIMENIVSRSSLNTLGGVDG